MWDTVPSSGTNTKVCYNKVFENRNILFEIGIFVFFFRETMDQQKLKFVSKENLKKWMQKLTC